MPLFRTTHARRYCIVTSWLYTKMLNFTVYHRTARKTLVPWRINKVTPPDVTFRGFYHEQGSRFVQGRSSGPSATLLELHATYVGSSKEQLDQVDPDLGVLEVIRTFGPYAKFLVEDAGGSESTASRCEGEFNRSPVMYTEKKHTATPFLSLYARKICV